MMALALPVQAYENPVEEQIPSLVLEGKTGEALALVMAVPDRQIRPSNYSPEMEKAIQRELAGGHLKDARGLLLRAILSGGENTAPAMEPPAARIARLQTEFRDLKIDDSALRRSLLAHLVTIADSILGHAPDPAALANEDWESWVKAPLAAPDDDAGETLIRQSTLTRRLLLLTTCSRLHAGNPAALEPFTRALRAAGGDEHGAARALLLEDGPVLSLALMAIAERNGGTLPDALQPSSRRFLSTALEARKAHLYVDPPFDSLATVIARDEQDLAVWKPLFRTSAASQPPFSHLMMHLSVWCRPGDERVAAMLVRLALKNPRFGGSEFQPSSDQANALASIGWSTFPNGMTAWAETVFADSFIRTKMPPQTLARLLQASPPSRDLAGSVNAYLREQSGRLDAATTTAIQGWLDAP